MKKILPIFLLLLTLFTIHVVPPVFAQTPTMGAPVGQPTPDVPYAPDSEVNFVGKAAARSIQFLNWTLQNYNWACIKRDAQGACDNSGNPLVSFWATIRNIIYAFFALFVLITAFVLLTTRGRSLTVQRFLPRFVAVIILVTFSFAMLQLIYVTADIIQGFFLTKTDGRVISAEDLLYVGWDYETFQGLRKAHPYFDESVFVNLLLARLTAVTYYAMTGVLLIRKIILWFFIVVSPIFPVLLLYYPIRNTAKIWIGEFFRWLLYAPLFSVFLAGLVSLWKAGIPLLFDFSGALSGKIVYPTATNILLGGPGQAVSINNNLNTPDTFAEYVVALIMLWVVLLLPFVLLQIFLDYLSNFSVTESPAFQKIINSSYTMLNRPVPPMLPPAGPNPSLSSGVAKQLPFAKFSVAQPLPEPITTGAAKELPIPMPIPITSAVASINPQILSSANISLPTMRDIVNYERAMISQRDTKEVEKTVTALQQIANPQLVTNPMERERFVKMREQLVQQSQSGDSFASSVLSAVNIVNNISNVNKNVSNQSIKNLKNALTQIANPTTNTTSSVVTSSKSVVTNTSLSNDSSTSNTTSTMQSDRLNQLHDTLVKESQSGNSLATTILSVTKETSNSQLQSIRDRLVQESNNNNTVATNVLATAMNSTESASLQQVIKEIANPQLASESTREQITQIHDTLIKESEKGSEIAKTILSTNETTSISQLQNIKEKLLDASVSGNTVATSILSTAISNADTQTTNTFLQELSNPASITNTVERERVTQLKEKLTQAQLQGNQFATTILTSMNMVSQSETTNFQNALQKIVNPTTATSTEREHITKLHDTLVKESEKGNELAKTILSVNQSTSVQEIEKIKEKVLSEKANGNPVAAEVATMMYTTSSTKEVQNLKSQLSQAKNKGEPLAAEMIKAISGEGTISAQSLSTLPNTNRVQAVSLEDYDAVRSMWSENYKNMDIPSGINSRKEWVSNDLKDVDNIISLLSSEDENQVREGMQEVSNVLPFLLLGGFSKDEIVSYLKAKQEAGKSVLEVIQQEESTEDTLVSVKTKHATASTSMARAQEIHYDTTSQSNDSYEDNSLLQGNLSQGPIVINKELVQLTNLQVPTMRDIVKFEVSMLSKNVNDNQSVTQVKETLQQLANPSVIASTEDRQRVEQIREKLVQNSQQGDQLATSILTAADHLSKSISSSSNIQTQSMQRILKGLSSPETAIQSVDKQTFSSLRDSLTKESAGGNPLAAEVLQAVNTISKSDVPEETKVQTAQTLQEKILKAKQEGIPIAASILSTISQTSGVALPKDNRIQTVSSADYQAVREMWQENYKNLEIPTGVANRKEWVAKEVGNISQIIDMLSSDNENQVQEGMQQVSTILPFLLLGGFSKSEIISYLQAKQEAGATVLQAMQQEENNEDTLVQIQSKNASGVSHAAMSQAMANTSETASADIPVETPIQILPTEQNVQNSVSLYNSMHLPLPTLHDIVRYEIILQSNDEGKKQEITQLHTSLEQVARADAQQDSIKAMLVQGVQHGDAASSAVLQAAQKMSNKETQIVTDAFLGSLREYFVYIVHPEQIKPELKERIERNILTIHAQLEQSQNDPIVQLLLPISLDTQTVTIQYIWEMLLEARKNGNTLAGNILGNFPSELQQLELKQDVPVIALPKTNQVQTVTIEEYEQVRKLWEDYYAKGELPEGETNRIGWINKEFSMLTSVITKLQSNDQATIAEGMESVSALLPFILLGGFSQEEIVSYLKAKQRAAESIKDSLVSQNDDTFVDQNHITQKQAVLHESLDSEGSTSHDPGQPQ